MEKSSVPLGTVSEKFKEFSLDYSFISLPKLKMLLVDFLKEWSIEVACTIVLLARLESCSRLEFFSEFSNFKYAIVAVLVRGYARYIKKSGTASSLHKNIAADLATGSWLSNFYRLCYPLAVVCFGDFVAGLLAPVIWNYFDYRNL